MKKYLYLLIIITGLLLSVGCIKNNSEDDGNFNFRQKTIIVRNELLEVNTNKSLSTFLQKRTNKNLVYENADCGRCLNELKQWNSLFPILNKNNNLILIAIVSSESKELALYNIIQKINFKYPLFYDKDSSFFIENNLKYLLSQKRTFLLDEHNNILKLGTPIYNDSLLREYQNAIK